MLVERGGKMTPTHHEHSIKRGDIVYFAVYSERLDEAHDWLHERGWTPVVEEEQAEEPEGEGTEDAQQVQDPDRSPDPAIPGGPTEKSLRKAGS